MWSQILMCINPHYHNRSTAERLLLKINYSVAYIRRTKPKHAKLCARPSCKWSIWRYKTNCLFHFTCILFSCFICILSGSSIPSLFLKKDRRHFSYYISYFLSVVLIILLAAPLFSTHCNPCQYPWLTSNTWICMFSKGGEAQIMALFIWGGGGNPKTEKAERVWCGVLILHSLKLVPNFAFSSFLKQGQIDQISYQFPKESVNADKIIYRKEL